MLIVRSTRYPIQTSIRPTLKKQRPLVSLQTSYLSLLGNAWSSMV